MVGIDRRPRFRGEGAYRSQEEAWEEGYEEGLGQVNSLSFKLSDSLRENDKLKESLAQARRDLALAGDWVITLIRRRDLERTSATKSRKPIPIWWEIWEGKVRVVGWDDGTRLSPNSFEFFASEGLAEAKLRSIMRQGAV